MSDVHRRSLDLPISRTLVALTRVRSLRDPSTSSLDILPGAAAGASATDNMLWETSSHGGVVLELNAAHDDLGAPHHDHAPPVPQRTAAAHRKPPTGVKLRGARLVRGARRDRAPRMSVDQRSGKGAGEDEVNSYQEMRQLRSPENSKGMDFTSRPEVAHPMRRRPAADAEAVAAAVSRVGSPCQSASEPWSAGSRRSSLGLGTQDTRVRSNDVVGSNFSGCGISYCWSGASRYRDLYSDSDGSGQERPLLSADAMAAASDGHGLISCAGTPRSLSQKFRPRSFVDLVGLSVVGQALLYASRKGKITPMYLFHGPRGTGKTTTARVFAAALNCLAAVDRRPCGLCKPCELLFAGKSRDTREIHARKLDQADRVAALLKCAALLPYSSRFRVFIVDECHRLTEEAWSAILKSLDEAYRHTVYIMVTAEVDQMPRTPIAFCQKFHFPKIGVADMIARLETICMREGLEFDHGGLRSIAARANGSLRDAETMLDQLSLLGKRITEPLVQELVGTVSDDELVELLGLALSADTTNTVRRARELMATGVDPLQLVSQLANVIMDILAGRCQPLSVSAASAGMRKMSHALKILSEAEKHLRTSKNQATWVTVALLQFSSGEPGGPLESNGVPAKAAAVYHADEWVSTTDASAWSVCHTCQKSKAGCSERQCRRLKLEYIWRRAVGKCQSRSLRSFLRNDAFLLSVHVTEEITVAEVGFSHPSHITKAEKVQTLMADSLSHVLGGDIEVRLKLAPWLMKSGDARVKRQSFSLLNCSGRKQDLSDTPPISDDDACNKSTPCIRPAADTDDPRKSCRSEIDYSKANSEDFRYDGFLEPELQPNCFARTMRLHKKLSSDAAQTICLRIQPAMPKKGAYDTFFCAYDPYDQFSKANSQATVTPKDETYSLKNLSFGSSMLCWKVPKNSVQ